MFQDARSITRRDAIKGLAMSDRNSAADVEQTLAGVPRIEQSVVSAFRADFVRIRFQSVLDRRPSGEVRANAAAHHLCVVADVEIPAGPEHAVRDAARDWGEADVFPFR